MAGHSKWKNIMHKKEKTDAQRAKVFTKLGREITMAVKDGGADPVINTRLRDLIAKAKANNIPNDNIERTIKKAAGGDGGNYDEITYEGYGPGGVAVIVETATDNRNRTASDLRHYFDKYGGNLGQSGCVGYLFSGCGVIIVSKEDSAAGIDEEALMETALEAGALDFSAEEGYYEIQTEPGSLSTVRGAIENAGFAAVSAELDKIPSSYISLTNEDDIKNMTLLLEKLEDNDDVQNVYNNWDNE